VVPERVDSGNEEIVNNNNDDGYDSEGNDDIMGIVPTVTRRVSGLQREIRNLTTEYNPNPGEAVELALLCRVFNPGETAMVANLHDGSPEPKNYHEAKACKEWKDWWEAMCTEFKNMEEKKVWKIIKKTELPSGRKLIGNRWVYAQKDDGRFRARTVAKGFSQVPGKDFQENHAPVVNDATFHLVLVLKILFQLEAGQFDIETAFLYGDLDEEIWMQLPEGYSEYVKTTHNTNIHTDTHCVKLLKALYGLVQAARQWWKKFKDTMRKLDYHPSPADPCLFINTKTVKKSFVIIYVDDGGIFSTKENIDGLLKALSKDFKVKYLGKLEHFVGCHVVENEERDTIWIHQPKLIKHLKESFSGLIKNTRSYKSPAAPKTLIMRPKEGFPLISPADQLKYRSAVGMLLYLVKHSRPDISNSVRELSKVADGATEAHWKAMARLVKYVVDTEEIGLRIKPRKKDDMFVLEGISDSEYAGDPDTRISVYGYILYFCGAPIAWKSKSDKSVTLSSTEAEYFALSEAAKEVIFVRHLVKSMGIEIEFPIIIKVDNVGAIYLSNNHTTSQRTKHIDIRHHFVREFIEDGILKVVFVRTDDNDADIFTKNTTEDLFNKHSKKMVEVVNSDNNI
jgi:hypothetical protein